MTVLVVLLRSSAANHGPTSGSPRQPRPNSSSPPVYQDGPNSPARAWYSQRPGHSPVLIYPHRPAESPTALARARLGSAHQGPTDGAAQREPSSCGTAKAWRWSSRVRNSFSAGFDMRGTTVNDGDREACVRGARMLIRA
ncbi:hypothetical protein MAPG_08732 [Magnaporthiopsis poae ATCC 64411]|uniref:Uncharacterized protein n=1 Tax=Magnaporthiopsis poae (strain ATCC 64411 / 73-15) TaxID=644358 RepID=A0A0C4E844_MAGP6|nr:hypothetical protein MAPG_08732 [Magnaporthiopsis poae ATCC 64411]